VANSNRCEGQMRTHKVNRMPHFMTIRGLHWRNNGRAWTLPETAFTSYFLRKVLWVIGKSFVAVSTTFI